MGNYKYDLEMLQKKIKDWQDPDLRLLAEEERRSYDLNKTAIAMYTNGESLAAIHSKTGIWGAQLYRMIGRCLSVDDQGKEYGYRAFCLERKHIQEPIKTKMSPFRKLLLEHPQLAAFIKGVYFGDKEYTLIRNISIGKLHTLFLRECARMGIQNYDYPFNTDSRGYYALRSYVQNLAAENLELQAKRESKDAMQALLSTGIGEQMFIRPVAPYQVVQVDGHKIDLLYTVEYETNTGEIKTAIAERVWLFVLIDIATRCVLGYSLSPETNYNQTDVLRAIHHAITPKSVPEMTRFPSLVDSYPAGRAFPDMVIPELEYCGFDVIMMDNAKSHLAADVLYKLRDTIGAIVNFGSVATPETRGHIERFFGTIERGLFHDLPMTTGSSTRDLKRRDPEKNALKYQFRYEDIEELVAYAIAVYNNSAHSSLDNETPIQAMERKVNVARIMPHKLKDPEKVSDLVSFFIDRVVRGGSETGRRPYVTYMGVRYRGDVLSSNMVYVGKKIRILVNPEDISHVKAYDGDTFLDELQAAGSYGGTKHSIKTRKLAQKNAKDNLRENTVFSQQVADLSEDLRARSASSKKARTRAATIRREANGTDKLNKSKKAEVIPIDDGKRPVYVNPLAERMKQRLAEGMTMDEIIELYRKELLGS